MAVAALLALAWRAVVFIKDRVEDGVKPVREDLNKTKGDASVLEARVKLSEEALNIFKIEAARTFSTKEDVMSANKPVLDSVERLTHSVDKMNTRIDRVIEQSNAAKPASRRRTAE